MDIENICDDITIDNEVTTTHISATEDYTITITRDNDDLGTEVCGIGEGIPNNQDQQMGSYQGNSKEMRNVSIYPNPSTGIYQIKSDQEIRVIKVYSTTGNLILEIPSMANSALIDLSEYHKGHYFIKVITDKGSYNSTIIKE